MILQAKNDAPLPLVEIAHARHETIEDLVIRPENLSLANIKAVSMSLMVNLSLSSFARPASQ